MKIYHYTTLENLALILKNKTLRFNRLDCVDDLDEGKTKDYGSLGRYVFASCWTDKREENIGLWALYSKNMAGVRIGLEVSNIVFERLYDGSQMLKNVQNLNENEQSFLLYDNYVKVDYSKTELPMFVETDDFNHAVLNMKYVSSYKDIAWEFQNELRFIIIAAKSKKKTPGEIFENIRKKNPIQADSLYLRLPVEVFYNMEIMYAPKISEGSKILCEALLKTYLPKINVLVEASNLHIR